jgi:hypothetical protein
MSDKRTRAVQRALRMLDGGASLEFCVGDAYNAGHVHGSAVQSLTDAEKDLANAVRELTEYEVQTIAMHVSPVIGALIEAVRAPEKDDFEEDTQPCLEKPHSLTGCYGYGHD